MYRESHPTSDAAHQPSLLPAAMLDVDMSRLPSIPSRPAPSQQLSPHVAYQTSAIAPSRPEFVPPTRHHIPRDLDGSQSHALKLPSLRTVLEPELLETKLPDPLSRLGGTHMAHGGSGRYGSSSPILKRRHDFDGYSHEYQESHAIGLRAPHLQRPAHSPLASDPHSLNYLASSSTPDSWQSEFSRHGSLGRPAHNEPANNTHRPLSTTSAMSASADLSGGPAAHDDSIDLSKPARRRLDGISRAPIRASRCLGQREVPGEGLCYIYEDGTFCRAVIDGEPVNPSWGITKAGKPRKRLAQACLTCREKKIKCEPGYPKCHQCAKSQRACRG
jgi:hypothetical protein